MLRLIATLVVLIAFAVPAASQNSNPSAGLAIHLQPAGGNGCGLELGPPACSQIVTNGALSPESYYAYVLVTDGNPLEGIAGLSLGIDYDGAAGSGVDIWGWTLCATAQSNAPGWPADGTTNQITWDTTLECQTQEPGGPGTGVVAVAGYFYVSAYSPDNLAIIPRPIDGTARVADCDASESVLFPSNLGYARFSAGAIEEGHNPCGSSGSEPADCMITGPFTVEEGTGAVQYSVQTDVLNPTYSWTVTGAAALVGPTNGQSVTVNTGPPGFFELHVAITAPDVAPASCLRSVHVSTDFNCLIPCGPAEMVQNDAEIFTAPPEYDYLWSIGGNGTIIGPNTGSSVTVVAGEPGVFRLEVRLTSNGVSAVHARTIIVGTPPPDPPNSQQNAKILLHLREATAKNPCAEPAATPGCGSVVTSGGLYPSTYNAFVLVADGHTSGQTGSGVAGVQFGIQYNNAPQAGVDIYGWTLCAAIEFPSPGWPASGTGNLVTWDRTVECQNNEPAGPGTGVVAAAGYFYLAAYTPDLLSIIPRPVDNAAKVANCRAAESIIVGPGWNPKPSPLGAAGFNRAGYNPCGLSVAVQPTTWSNIKSMFD